MANKPSPDAFKRCPHCDSPIPEMASVCMYCGQSVAVLTKKKGVKFSDVFAYTVAFVILLLIANNVSSRNAANDTPTVRPTFTPTAIATQPPTPTVVAAAAAIVAATATPTPQVPQDVREYLSEVLPHINDMAQAIIALSDLFGTPQIGNDDWTLSVAAKLMIIQFSHKSLVDVIAPPSMSEVHSALLAGSTGCHDATLQVVEGFDNNDAAALDRALVLFGNCQAGITLATQRLNSFLPASPQSATANQDANLRSGPGTEYEIVGGVRVGQGLDIVARNEAGDWYQLADGAWVAGFLVDGAPSVEVGEEATR